MTDYQNAFDLDGRLKRNIHVNERKVAAVKSLLEQSNRGNRIASAQLQELLTTTDAIFNLAHLANLNFVPNYDEAPRTWTQVAGTRTVDDFRPVTLYSINRSWTDGNGASNVLSDHGAAPVIPEGTAYPYAYIAGEVQAGAGVSKKGLKTDWTLESRINDGLGAIRDLPSQLLQVSLDTEEEEVWGAITTQLTAASDLDGGVTYEGWTVPANGSLTRDALIQAIFEISQRTINGRQIQVTGGYNLVVPLGRGVYANFILNQGLGALTRDTNAAAGTASAQRIYSIGGGDPLAGISVVESEWVTGTAWMLIPKVGATKRPVIERLSLRGYETPQLFVENHVGSAVGGGNISPFEGDFDADVITLKLRQFGGGIVWDGGEAIVRSTGAGGPGTGTVI
jgi:hypothetical protein